MSVSPAREALNVPAKRPSVLVDDMPGKARVGLCLPAASGIIAFRRVPNYTGAGDSRFHADFTFRPDDGSEWRGHVVVWQMTPDGAEFPRFETTVYRAGRMLPDGQLGTLRDAALQCYLAAFPWAAASNLKAWAADNGASAFCDSYGTWGRAATVDGKGFTYRGETGDTASTLACLVEDIRAGVEYVAPPAPAPVADLPEAMTWAELQAAASAGSEAAKARIQAMKESPTLATSDGVRVAGTIDLTPTWAAVLPVYLAAYADGNAKGRAAAIAELTRMAELADSAVAASREVPAAVAWRTGSDITLDPARAENWRAMGATVYPLADLPGKAV